MTQKNSLYRLQIWPIKQQFSNADLYIQECPGSLWLPSQLFLSIKQLPVLLCGVFYHAGVWKALFLFCFFFYQKNHCTWMRNCFSFFFFLLNRFSHRISDRRLIVCFQCWLFSSPGSIFETIFIFGCPDWDDTKLERLVQILLTSTSDDKGCPPLICHLQGRQRPEDRETMPDGVQERIPPDALCFVDCF